MRIADAIALKCKELNEHTFLFVGGGNMYLADALGQNKVPYVCMHHEQALSMAAEAYARITGMPSVCIVTTGPGGINALNGVAGAWLDSIPMIVISGQVRLPMMKTPQMRQMGDQELPITEIVRPITKMAEILKQPFSIGSTLLRAVEIASQGRPGPVWLDVPLDIQALEYPAQDWNLSFTENQEFDFKEVFEAFAQAKKPMILAGNGIRVARAAYSFRQLIDACNIPVALSVNAMDLLPTGHPSNMGAFGTCGHQVTNDLIQEADLLLILGCRMNLRQTGYNFGELGKKAIKIMVDIDAPELYKDNFVADIKINKDLHFFINALRYNLKGCANWITPKMLSIPVTPLITHILDISEAIQDQENVIVCANGTIPTFLNRYLTIREGDRYIVNSGLGSMGYGLPAAIGAALASKKRVICFEGDGSLQLNIQELQTIRALNLNVKLFVINNGGYASMQATQDTYFKGNYVGRGSESGLTFPDLQRIAWAYQIPYETRISEASLSNLGPVIYGLNILPEIPYKGSY